METKEALVAPDKERIVFIQELPRITNPYIAADYCVTFAGRHGLSDEFAKCGFNTVVFYTLMSTTNDRKKFDELLADLVSGK